MAGKATRRLCSQGYGLGRGGMWLRAGVPRYEGHWSVRDLAAGEPLREGRAREAPGAAAETLPPH